MGLFTLLFALGLSGCDAQTPSTETNQNVNSNRTTETVRKDRKGKKSCPDYVYGTSRYGAKRGR